MVESGVAAAEGPTAMATRLRVGTDLQRVDAVEESLRTLGRRYVERVFTDHEQECVGLPVDDLPSVAPGLAARFAAKEATIKVLRPVDGGIGWRDIEVRRHEGGWCSVELSGTAAMLAERAGLGSFALSFSHESGFAVATVIAVEESSDGSGQDR
ncbi:MAG: holo-ACP synthase [Nocardioidaceae bacterium]